ncbi:MAG TPA: MFS transporter [Gammaproteobacteria bacterium]|nr:MFS transporter [Gammaproteobacteria bacterium]
MTAFFRNVPLLAAAQALMMSGNALLIAASALVGHMLAEDKSLATLPLAAQFIATMLTSIPAAMLMERFGRKPAFVSATLLGVAGAGLAATATLQGSFWLFVLATMFIGAFNGFGNYYRFAAADSVHGDEKARAVSWVMAGGVIAAVVGPNLARYTRDTVDAAPFAGTFLALISVYLLAMLVLSAISLPKKSLDHFAADFLPPRSLPEIARQKAFIVALCCGMLGYGVMSLVMTATPLAMHHHHHAFDDTAFVIQWHVLGMFAPSFVTGTLITRYGLDNILGIGALLGLACVAINLVGTSLWHFWIALVLLGVSWNFLFIGATTLLTDTYHANERAKTQAINDFAVFTTVALASLSADYLQHQFGWETVNIGVIPLLIIILASVAWLKYTPNNTAETVRES